ncbi:hypothetical protein CROQUDRAFT_98043 [Cronartium quercuum f. sp. fusiforme G11]|uniref:Uncharacterized protein n=1 Tax=Cronartium quercuum f. sp. fusiforme G11 TaxID=708437 RepID=A0A9P6NDI9_9BASI|nr:hypothetical protein CROQUDRAFT_98043 [Cronartium quercuum f. sp. fusiforme G11]
MPRLFGLSGRIFNYPISWGRPVLQTIEHHFQDGAKSEVDGESQTPHASYTWHHSIYHTYTYHAVVRYTPKVASDSECCLKQIVILKFCFSGRIFIIHPSSFFKLDIPYMMSTLKNHLGPALPNIDHLADIMEGNLDTDEILLKEAQSQILAPALLQLSKAKYHIDWPLMKVQDHLRK